MFEERRLKRKFFILGSMLYLGIAFNGDKRVERVVIERGNDNELITTLDGFREIQEHYVVESLENAGKYRI